MQILAFAFKEGVRLHFQHHVKIARGTAIRANVTLFLVTNPRAVFHACRHAHINHVLFHHAAFALALAAWIGNHPPQPLAGWARPRDAEHGLLVPHLAATGTRGARAGTFGPR